MSEDPDIHGGGEGGHEAPPPQPQRDDRFDRFESRLNQVTEAISNLSRNQETRDIRSRISQRTAQIDGAVRASERAVDAAEQALADAYEAGEGAIIAKAQRDLSEKIAAREHARIEKRNHDQAVREIERRSGGSEGTPGAHAEKPKTEAKDTTNLDNWKKKHASWYGIDAEMTKAAHEVDRTIREAGVIPVGSQQYFEAIDRQMTKRFPEQLRDTPSTASGGGGQRNSGASRPNTGRIPRDVIDGWERMGINVSDPRTLERMVSNRAALADKGILPSEPAYGMVRPR